MDIINVKKFEYQNWGGINMEFRNSIDSAFGRVRYDLYDKRRELECEMMRKNWRNNNGYLEMEAYWWLKIL